MSAQRLSETGMMQLGGKAYLEPVLLLLLLPPQMSSGRC